MSWVAGILRGAEVQARVIGALALRETRTRFGQQRIGYLWAVLEPLLWVATFAGLYHIGNRATPMGMEMLPFLTTGIIGYEVAMKTADRVSASINGNKALLFYPQVQTLDIVFARALLELATLSTVLGLILVIHGMLGGNIVIANPIKVFQALLLASAFGTSLGLLMCAGMVAYPVIERVKGPLFRPLFWISGLFFAAEFLPSNIRDAFLYNPILHCIELLRDGFFESYTARHADPMYVLSWTTAFAFIGLTLERRLRSKVQLS